MSSFVDVEKIKIRKVWSEGEEIVEQEGIVEDEANINQIIETVGKASPFDGFYPSKLETPGYLLTFFDEDEEKELTLEGDIIVFDDGLEKALPIGKLTLVKLLDGVLTNIKTKIDRMTFEDAYRQVANG